MPNRRGIEVSDEDALEIDRLEAEAEHYDRMQYIKKIQLNS